MLTVDYRRLRVAPGDRLLDLGCGAGRHAFEAMRLGADVTALDMDLVELKTATGTMAAVRDEGATGPGRAVQGSALDLPFPDDSFDRVIAAEVLEHIGPDERALRELARVLRPGGTMAVTVPRWFPELVNWALSDEYHAPAAVGGHVRIYREGRLVERLTGAGLSRYDRHHAHGLHAPYWWLKCAVGLDRDDHPLVRAYHRVLVDQIVRNPLHLRLAERALQPLLGKSLVLYVTKPDIGGGAATDDPAGATVGVPAGRATSRDDVPGRTAREGATTATRPGVGLGPHAREEAGVGAPAGRTS